MDSRIYENAERQVVGVAFAGSSALTASCSAILSVVPMATCSDRSAAHRSCSRTLRTFGPSSGRSQFVGRIGMQTMF